MSIIIYNKLITVELYKKCGEANTGAYPRIFLIRIEEFQIFLKNFLILFSAPEILS